MKKETDAFWGIMFGVLIGILLTFISERFGKLVTFVLTVVILGMIPIVRYVLDR